MCRLCVPSIDLTFEMNLMSALFFLYLKMLLLSQQAGQALPAVEVHEGEPGNKVSMDQLFKGKNGVLFAVPGAFTPGCSKVESLFLLAAPCAVTASRLLSDPQNVFILSISDPPPRFCGTSCRTEE